MIMIEFGIGKRTVNKEQIKVEQGPTLEISKQVHQEKYRGPNESFYDAMVRLAGTLNDGEEHRHKLKDIFLTKGTYLQGVFNQLLVALVKLQHLIVLFPKLLKTQLKVLWMGLQTHLKQCVKVVESVMTLVLFAIEEHLSKHWGLRLVGLLALWIFMILFVILYPLLATGVVLRWVYLSGSSRH